MSHWDYNSETNTAIVKEGLPRLRIGAFRSARRLRHLHLPESLQSLPNDLCRHAAALQSVSLPAHLDALGSYAFANCSELKELILPEGPEVIPEGFCARAKSLHTVHLPASIQRIDTDAFLGCTSLASINLPPHLKIIADGAFADCASLTHLSIPPEVKTLPLSALPHGGICEGIDIEGQIDGIESRNGILLSSDGTAILYWPPGQAVRSLQVPEEITSIADNAFRGARHLERLVLPKNLRFIGRAAFAECKQLRHVVFQSAPEWTDGDRPENGLFFACSSLSQVQLPEESTTLPDFCFAHSGLTQIHLPEALRDIGRGAFYGCHLTHLALPKETRKVGDHAFYGATAVTLPAIDGCRPGRLCCALSQIEPCHNCYLHLPKGAVPCLWQDNADAWRHCLNKLKVKDGDIDWQTLDHASSLLQDNHAVDLALARLESAHCLDEENAQRYRQLLLRHAGIAARKLISQRKEEHLATLLNHVRPSADELPDLIQLAEHCAMPGAMRLLMLHADKSPRRFSL